MKKLSLLLPAIAGVLAVSAHAISAATISQDFASDPLQDGWQVFGDTNLFHWNPVTQNLEVTWDSSKPNSYFYHPLGTILAKDDDFSVAFDLRLDDIGPANSYLWSFAISVGFLNLKDATGPGFLRGTGNNTTNLVEFVYFRDDPYGDPATVYPTFVDRTGQFNYNVGQAGSTNYVLTVSNVFHVAMTYTASNQALVTILTNLTVPDIVTITQHLGLTFFGDPFTDFRLDAISINSYSEAGQYSGYEGSVLAHGVVDNFTVTVPPPPVQNFTGVLSSGVWQSQFGSRTNWNYTLERSTNFSSWADVSTTVLGNGTNLILEDLNLPQDNAFYRVRAALP
jgi:hypothetical protein